MYNICWPNRICTDKWNVYQKILLIKYSQRKRRRKMLNSLSVTNFGTVVKPYGRVIFLYNDIQN